MKNIKTKKGEFDVAQLLIGMGFLFLGIVFFLLSFIPMLGSLFFLLGIAVIWTSWYEVYYCINCGNKHGEYPYNSCEKCGGRKFIHNKKLEK